MMTVCRGTRDDSDEGGDDDNGFGGGGEEAAVGTVVETQLPKYHGWRG